MRNLNVFMGLIALMTIASTATSAVPGVKLKPLNGVKRILILGDSITYGGGYVDTLDAYLYLHCPKQRFEVINIGLPSENLSGLTEPGHAGGAFPRPDLHERLDRALKATTPDLVVACYGMNDGIYYPFDAQRFAKFTEGIQWLQREVAKIGAKFWVLTPPPFDCMPIKANTLPAGRDAYPQPYVGYDEVLTKYSEWLVSLRKQKLNVVDIHTPLNAFIAKQRKTDPNYALAGDGVHINVVGHHLVARELLKAWGAPDATLPAPELGMVRDDYTNTICTMVAQRQAILKDGWITVIGHKRPGMAAGLPLGDALASANELDRKIRDMITAGPPPYPGAKSDYHGFDMYTFAVDGCKAMVALPKTVAKGKPWIWRAEFFDHRPELDRALLERGFHLVYIEVGNTFGAPSAMKHWDAFYALLTEKYGLSKKPVLEGLSRGGLYIYNWASANPTKVLCLYGDNPVCDFKSWPGGKGKGPGSPDDWRKLIGDYGFKDEAEALAYTKNPIDNLAPLAKAHVPIIHLAADADEVVPYEENTVVLKQRYEQLGGKITVIVKHGFQHHPHGLDDPKPLLDFIMSAMK